VRTGKIIARFDPQARAEFASAKRLRHLPGHVSDRYSHIVLVMDKIEIVAADFAGGKLMPADHRERNRAYCAVETFLNAACQRDFFLHPSRMLPQSVGPRTLQCYTRVIATR